MAFVVGVDIGSGYCKAVVLQDRVVRSSAVLPSGGDYRKTADGVIRAALAGAHIALSDIACTVSAGYGAASVEFADFSVPDISCHAAAIHHLFPSVRTVVDVGAQFSRAIRLNEEGRATSFLLNEKCAGGSGKFLQVVARILKIGVEEIAALPLAAAKPVEFTTACAVFAESEAVSRIAEGAPPADIVAGVHKAMASKISTLVIRVGLAPDCAATGGGAKHQGLVRVLGEELRTRIFVPEEPQLTGALGAALMASDKASS